ncbi:hypothetical protein C5Y96_19045 [Blastopirellula marina]|uniref:Uncharacterized protein n=1 Tax=Blastopirellula marina TaxID=124 RepID=A0A2S8F634_9BACT|nr:MULTISPECIES: hypothetical protein [Pirellulaceae]PQO27625.1 hypothetical protein C5Y96_19045 [Blastopirellula marina]RCS48163.1 hypothetical protein DTL36_19075 [Bremerella cremea]
MNQPDPKWYLLGVVVLAFFAIQIPRWFDGPAYSQEECLQVCKDAFARYQSLKAAKAPEAEWEAFHGEVLPRLDAITKDHEENVTMTSTRDGARSLIYQVAKYNLPELIRNKNDTKTLQHSSDIDKQLAQAEKVMLAPTTPARPNKKPKTNSSQGWDPVIVAILIGDLAIALVGGGFWLWRS